MLNNYFIEKLLGLKDLILINIYPYPWHVFNPKNS